MKRILLVMVAAAFLVTVSAAFGQNTNIQFTYGTSTFGTDFGSDKTGLYGATVNGVATQIICDDFYHNIYDGETWTAHGYSAAGLNAGNVDQTQFDGHIGLFGYTELAWLANQMFTLSTSDPTYAADLGLISQAMWHITSGAAPDNTWADQASAFATANPGTSGLQTFKNLYLYTPTNMSQGGPQEMWGQVPVPEGGAAVMYLLLAGVTCFGAMFYSRRRITMGDLA